MERISEKIKGHAGSERTKLSLLGNLEETEPQIVKKGESYKLETIFIAYHGTKGGVLGII